MSNLKLSKPSNLIDRETNKQLVKQAEAIVLARRVELEGNNYNLDSEAGKKTIVTDWMQSYINTYTKKDKRNMQGVRNRFDSFLIENKMQGLNFGNLTALISVCKKTPHF